MSSKALVANSHDKGLYQRSTKLLIISTGFIITTVS